MSEDPHRDALAAALARITALEDENRALRDSPVTGTLPAPPPVVPGTEKMIDETLEYLNQRLDAESVHTEPPPAPEHAHPGAARPACASCGGHRTLRVKLKQVATIEVGANRLKIGQGRVCANCGHLSLVLDQESREWLSERYLSALIAQDEE